jgi:hypothetical protein
MERFMEKKVSIEMFGGLRRIPATGDHRPSQGALLAPMERADGVARLFCVGCGSLYELAQESVVNYQKQAGTHTVAPHTYFEVGGCVGCDGDQSKIQLKEIPSDAQ